MKTGNGIVHAQVFSRILVIHPQGIAIWEDILRGIYQFARPDLPWLLATDFEYQQSSDDWKLTWKPDGVIAQCSSPQDEEFLSSLGVPVVNVAREQAKLAFPSVQIDDELVGEMAANYYVERGFGNLACYTLTGRDFMEARVAGFIRKAKELGREVVVFEAQSYSSRQNLMPPGSELENWLRDLPEQTGVFATSDALGVVVSGACRFLGIELPRQLSILGASNNELICNLEHPPLSSIELPGKRLGFEAAKLLWEMLSGKPSSGSPMRLPPMGVVDRLSTDICCINDPHVSEAMKFIEANFTSTINVASVVRAAELSRSSLERRFRKLLGKSILDELVSRRIELAKHLLASTERTLVSVAKSAGFSNAKQFAASFKKHVGQHPTGYRNRVAPRQ